MLCPAPWVLSWLVLFSFLWWTIWFFFLHPRSRDVTLIKFKMAPSMNPHWYLPVKGSPIVFNYFHSKFRALLPPPKLLGLMLDQMVLPIPFPGSLQMLLASYKYWMTGFPTVYGRDVLPNSLLLPLLGSSRITGSLFIIGISFKMKGLQFLFYPYFNMNTDLQSAICWKSIVT